MTAIISRTPRDDEICGICQEGFNFFGRSFTHIGGERHDGFHKDCLSQWLNFNPICPIDRQPLDRNSLQTRTEWIMARLKPAIPKAGIAALIAGVLHMGFSELRSQLMPFNPFLTVIPLMGVVLSSWSSLVFCGIGDRELLLAMQGLAVAIGSFFISNEISFLHEISPSNEMGLGSRIGFWIAPMLPIITGLILKKIFGHHNIMDQKIPLGIIGGTILTMTLDPLLDFRSNLTPILSMGILSLLSGCVTAALSYFHVDLDHLL